MIRTLERSPIRELLDMIEAKAPLFMRCGGLVQLYERGATYEQREAIVALYLKGHPRQVIADRVGVLCAQRLQSHAALAPYPMNLDPIHQITARLHSVLG